MREPDPRVERLFKAAVHDPEWNYESPNNHLTAVNGTDTTAEVIPQGRFLMWRRIVIGALLALLIVGGIAWIAPKAVRVTAREER